MRDGLVRRVVSGPVKGLLDVGPHDRAHVPAIRAGGSISLPLLFVWFIGHPELAPFVAFGAMTGIYGRNVSRRHRAAMQSQAAVSLVVAVVLGTIISLYPERDWLLVVAGATFAAVVSVAAHLLAWRPPGPLFQLFGLAVCANTAGSTWHTVGIAFLVSSASALFAILFSLIGRRETNPRPAPGLPGPRQAWDHFRSDATMRHIVRMGGATLVTGALTTLMGIGHPYWGMVAAAAPLAAPTTGRQVQRGLHRIIGTLGGLVIAALCLLFLPQGLPIIIAIIIFQAGAELFVIRNYTLGLLSITPLALLMGQLVHPQPIGTVLWDRGVETAVGVLVSVAFTFLTHADDDSPEADDEEFLEAVSPR
ncbi:Fusaric acid resistance protein-like [Raineyella antarctica]|uniref:Fusaric acid resistance protein-like n=1 Tax=Raineyella antarctica TaxID=1577474 RepID=A0A1G6HI98_9ACTN|nr:FUSC family protein [Raineyella antarctica]SDB93931.1 Fusaric acid resistance protein-like [Raineyella antarctica]